MKSAASWMTLTKLGRVPGSIVAANGRTWGFCRIRIEYRVGGHCVAVVPLWLSGLLHSSRLIRAKGGGMASTAGVMYNRFWALGKREGWIRIEEYEAAGEQRERELADESQALAAKSPSGKTNHIERNKSC